jgi:hypothetical protein
MVSINDTLHSLFAKKILEDKMKSCSGGRSLLIEARTLKSVNLISIGFKYNSSKMLCFVAAKNAGSKLLGKLY